MSCKWRAIPVNDASLTTADPLRIRQSHGMDPSHTNATCASPAFDLVTPSAALLLLFLEFFVLSLSELLRTWVLLKDSEIRSPGKRSLVVIWTHLLLRKAYMGLLRGAMPPTNNKNNNNNNNENNIVSKSDNNIY